MKQPETLTLHILDKEYHLTCPADKRLKLQRAANYLDKIMREIRSCGKAIGVERIAVTAALNITYELLEIEGKNSNEGQQKLL